jgi:hypothetical protein
MADDITLNPGTGGAIVATDEISGRHHELVKIEFGPDGTATLVQDTAPLPVKLMSSLVPERYDELVLGYTGDDLTTVVYKLATVTVATLTLSYTSGRLTGVVRT